MANMAAYNLPQSVFMMSLGSNSLFGQVGSQAKLQTNITNFLKGKPGDSAADQGLFFSTLNTPSPNYPCLKLPSSTATYGDWGTVWGPVVYVATDNLGATNTMFVAHSPSQNIYVVAIAGTNPMGWSALCIQDLAVDPSKMVTWPPTINSNATPPTLTWQSPGTPDPSSPAIDKGTSDGISQLFIMRDPNSKQTVAQYLSSVSQSGQTLVFTGHSLGGALSPTMAMLLYPQAAKTKGSSWANVYILASAGPTPGTPGFAANFYTTTGATGLGDSPKPVPVNNPPPAPSQATGNYAPVATGVSAGSGNSWAFSYWNVDYANVYDVVPRAWDTLQNLVQARIPPISYPSFFANGAALESGYDSKMVPNGPGPDTFALIEGLKVKAGYKADGSGTPYYTPCLLHSAFTGTWGSWTSDPKSYPPAWNSTTPPSEVTSMDDVMTWILNAHLGQYSKAFLGYPCPTMKDT